MTCSAQPFPAHERPPDVLTAANEEFDRRRAKYDEEARQTIASDDRQQETDAQGKCIIEQIADGTNQAVRTIVAVSSTEACRQASHASERLGQEAS